MDRTRPFAWSLAACLALLAGCDGARTTAPPLPQVERGDGRVRWQGVMPCADCEGIETTLTLERTGDARRYDLVETYLAGDGARFVEQGRWRREGELVRLQSDAGGVRAFALLSDGRLQARDTRGRRLPTRVDDLLEPVAIEDAP